MSLVSRMILCDIGRQILYGAGLEAYRCSCPDNQINHFLMAAARHVPSFSLAF